MSSSRGSFTSEGPRRPGPRQERARRDRELRVARRRRRTRWLLVLAGVALVVGGAGGAWLLTEGALPWSGGEPDVVVRDDEGDETTAAGLDALEDQQRLLLATVPAEGESASSVTVLAGPAEDVPASALFLPTGTLASIPGFGRERLGRAYRYGGQELLAASVENLLGVRLDATAVASHDGFADFLDRAGQLPVELERRLVERGEDGVGEVRFERGQQQLDGERAAELWMFAAEGDELAAARHRRRILDALFEATGQDTVLDRLVTDGAPQLGTDVGGAWLREFFADLAQARAEDDLRANLLPVEALGSAGAEGARAYQLDDEEAERLVGRFFGRVDLEADGPTRVQVLNGVGTPGVGQLVDERLPEDMRITLTGNASSFDFEETRVLVYTEEAEAVRAGERVQEALGVGTIQVSRQPQSVVDVTIVAGADLVADAGGEVPEIDTEPDDPEQDS